MQVDENIPLYFAARYINLFSFLERLESLFLLIWIFGFTCYISIVYRFSIKIFEKINNIEKFNIVSPIFVLLIFLIALLPKNYSEAFFFESKIYPMLVLAVVFGLGLIILICAKLKQKQALKISNNFGNSR